MTNCDCSNNGIKAYFKLDYKPNKLSQLANDTHYVDINDVLDEINTHNTSETAHTYIQGRIDATNTTIGDLTELDTSVKTSVVDAINSVISDEATIVGDLDDLDTSVKTSIVTAINSEVSDRQSADSGLQTQIDALAASSDVTDIVGTYAELQAYDTQHLNDNDIIKVLDDSTHNDAPSYYRYNKSTDSFTYIGSESASYTKAESDTLFVPQTRTVNSKALSADITLTSSDVGALASTTTINDLTTTAQQNALNSGATTTNIGQIATNTSSISTINGKIPSDASSSNKLVTTSALSNAVVNLADKDLANLTQTGEERLHALKAYSDKGELLTDAEGLADVTNYAHSTFDLSKFTVVDSPVITSDGIASGFSNSNFIRNTYSIASANKVVFKGMVIKNYQSGGLNPLFYGVGTYGTPSLSFLSNGNLQLYSYDGTNTGNAVCTFSEIPVSTGEYFYYECEISNEQRVLKVSADGKNWITKTNTTLLSLNLPTAIATIYIGGIYQSGSYYSGSIDLKQFSITVDGVPVFSGNKTGIDTIKPDDYTEVNSPVISTDGVMTLDGTNAKYVTTSSTIALSTAGTWKIETPVFTLESRGSDASAIRSILGVSSSQDGIDLFIRPAGKVHWTIYKTVGDNTSAIVTRDVDTPLLVNGDTKYQLAIEFTGTAYNLLLSTNGSVFTRIDTIASTEVITYNPTLFVGYRHNVPGKGIMDLNLMHVYINGNLVYQPCLKIPYTESKTGSKIVDSIYRDRVNDMAEQFGSAPYYTLSDTDFTLPQVELYGLIGQRTLKASYRNGISYWELWSDRTLEQGGTCTSGVEYTLLKPFSNTNYVLTIPYTSKTATTFIPSATGDFIAKGVGTL